MQTAICARCQRPVLNARVLGGVGISAARHGPLVRAYATHAYKGCDTGCCGYIAQAEDAEGNTCEGHLEFDHPGRDDDARTWMTSFVNEEFPGVPIDFEMCDVAMD